MNQSNAAQAGQQPKLHSNIEFSIAERRAYYKQQEALIAQQAKEGNEVLHSLRYAIREAELILKDLKKKCRTAKENLAELETDMDTARNDFLKEVAEHEKLMATNSTSKT